MDDLGFLLYPNVLSPSECEALIQALSPQGIRRVRAGTRNLIAHPKVSALARSPKLLEIARCWTGPGATPYRATLFEKTGEHNWLVTWHQDATLPIVERVDSDEWGPWSVKAGITYSRAPSWALTKVIALRVHLDSSSLDNGPLKVIFGSHAAGVLTEAEILRVARTSRATEIECDRGAVLAMRPLLIHASSKASKPAPRRVLHVEYAPSLDLAPNVRLALA
jgi:ectoine hydroxylase-related dioxygenase (phytanoyl-CoA dioxygenase family)